MNFTSIISRYIEKKRGDLISENPLTVRLNFEPAGRPSTDYDRYYLMDKANKCVVCGVEDSILRKNIVPHEYRTHFPAYLKVFSFLILMMLSAKLIFSFVALNVYRTINRMIFYYFVSSAMSSAASMTHSSKISWFWNVQPLLALKGT